MKNLKRDSIDLYPSKRPLDQEMKFFVVFLFFKCRLIIHINDNKKVIFLLKKCFNMVEKAATFMIHGFSLICWESGSLEA